MPSTNPYISEYQKLTDIIDELKAVLARESNRHMMDEHLDPATRDLIEFEIIPALEEYLDYQPSDADLSSDGEPPMSADERWNRDLQQHRELHS
jgi:hypothetical protein